MVTEVTGLSRRGLYDWVIQRVTAVILAVYTLVVVGYVLFSGDLGFAQWRQLFDQTWMQIFTLLAVISTCAHAWIGMWTIGTDYIQDHYFGSGSGVIRFLYQVFCVITLVIYLVWSIKILWGN